MLVTTVSVTAAQRLARELDRRLGIAAAVVHTPAEINSGSCSYSVRFDDRYEADARRLVNKYNLEVRRFYRGSGTAGSEYYAVP